MKQRSEKMQIDTRINDTHAKPKKRVWGIRAKVPFVISELILLLSPLLVRFSKALALLCCFTKTIQASFNIPTITVKID